MSDVEIIRVSREQLLAERATIRSRWGLDEREFAPTEAWRDLFLEEHLAQVELDDISFLLGER